MPKQSFGRAGRRYAEEDDPSAIRSAPGRQARYAQRFRLDSLQRFRAFALRSFSACRALPSVGCMCPVPLPTTLAFAEIDDALAQFPIERELFLPPCFGMEVCRPGKRLDRLSHEAELAVLEAEREAMRRKEAAVKTRR